MEKFLKFPISGSTYQLLSCTGIILIEQATATTTTIAYKASDANTDVVTITHGSVANDDFRDFLQNQVIAALETPWTSVAYTVTPPVAVSNIAIA
jgi:hypothetical protein